jgi:glyoxylase-like metal-dependent hydrolase (beta-lactamase superfamily II)
MSDQAWTQPGAFEVAPGVLRIPLPLALDGLRAVNVYAIEDGGGLLMVDAGWFYGESMDALRSGLKAAGRDVSEISRFVVTHIHGDHYTLAMPIREESGARVAIGSGERDNLTELLEDPAGERRMPETRQLIQAGAPEMLELFSRSMGDEGVRSSYELPDQWIDDGAVVTLADRTLQAIATPGHTQGHTVFRDEAAGLLFAGDHILPHITPSIGYEPSPAPLPLADFLTSLAKVRRLPDALLLPAHGPVAGSVHERIGELLDHHEQRFAAVAAALDKGATTAAEVATHLGWTRRARALADLDVFNRYLAIAETLAHLDVMSARGWITRALQADGSIWFSR